MHSSLRAAALSATFFLMGCPPAGTQQFVRPAAAAQPDSEASREALSAALDLYEAGRYADAEKALAAVAARHAGTDAAVQAGYRRGVCLARLDRPKEARTVLQDLLQKAPEGSWMRAARLELASVESKLGHVEASRELVTTGLSTALSDTERREAAASLEALLTRGSAELKAFRDALDRVEGGDETARDTLAQLVEGKLTDADVVLLHAAGAGGKAQGWLAARVARMCVKAGDVAGARRAVDEALDAGAAPYEAELRQLAGRLALHDTVRPDLVGVVLPLTGKLKPFGEAIRDGILLALPDDGSIALDVRDSEGDPARAADAVEALARDGAIAIVGPVGLAEAPAAAQRAAEVGVPMVSLSRGDGVTSAGAWVFRNSLTNAQQGRALARYVREVLGSKEAATLVPDLPTSAEVAGAFRTALEASGGSVKAAASYESKATTFSAPIRQLVTRTTTRTPEQAAALKAAQAEPNDYKRKKLLEKLGAASVTTGVAFDALLIPDIAKTIGLIAPALAVEDIITQGCDEKAVDLVRKTQKRDTLRTVTLLGTSSWNTPDLVTRGGRYVQCAVLVDGFFADSARPATRAFTDAFVAKYERRPNLLEAQGYDAARIVVDRLRTSAAKTREALRDAVAGLQGFDGATGDTTFGPDREADKPLFFLTIDKSGLRELEDVRLSPAGLAAPAPESKKNATAAP